MTARGVRSVKEKKILELHIEKGSKTGTKIKFDGESDEHPGKLPGDIVFVLKEKEHPDFKRRNADLLLQKEITLVEALTGFSFTLTHLDGREIVIQTTPGKVIKPNEVMVIDLAVPISHAATKLQDMAEGLGDENTLVLTTIPASTSSNMIALTMNELENLDSMVALTKLDECDITTAEFSSLATMDAKIGLFSASKSIMDAPIFASQNVLMQYLKENLDYSVKQDTINDRPDILT